MSAELPQLERLLVDAAERHYGERRRLRVPAPRPSLVAGLVAAAAAVALAITVLPLGSDEQPARPPAAPTGALAARYSVFGPAQDAGPLAFQIARDQLDALDSRKPVAARWLRRFPPGGGIVAVAGTGPRGEAAVCVSEQHTRVAGGTCEAVSVLLSEPGPWFPFGAPGQSDTAVMALVPDGISSVRMRLESGATRDVPIARNLAYARAGETVCEVSWTTADGRTENERSLSGPETPLRC